MMDDLLGDAETMAALRALRPDGDAVDDIARAAWSIIAEPGDGVAGALLADLGAAEALRFALDDAPGTGRATVSTERANQALAEARARWRPRADRRAVGEALRAAAHVSAALIVPGDTHWPTALDELGDHTPSVLWVRGDPGLLIAEPRVAIVGARASTGYGDHLAAELAGDLASDGAVIVSGGAYGIDGAAHRAALGVGGATVAFLAGGVDRAYPSGHRQLLGSIVRSGAVVSELPCGAAPTKWRFLARNRLIAALGEATVVVEAGWRSGSLNTAGHAAALGRPLGAVPGPVTSAASAGCHRLLREYDARCVTSAAEIRELWGADAESPAAAPLRDDPDQIRLGDALSTRAARSPQDLAARSGLTQARVIALLGLLALEGAVVRDERGWRAATMRERL